MKKLLVAALLLATPAFAALPPLSASLGYASEVFSAREYDLVDGDDHFPMWQFGAAYSLTPARGTLDLGLQFQIGETNETAYQAIQTGLLLRGGQVTATWRYPLYTHLEPYARLAGGVDWATLTLGGDQRLQQTVARPVGNALLGVQVPMPLRGFRPDGERVAALVLDVGVGYSVRPGFAFTALEPKAPDEPPEDPIDRVPTNLGSMSLSGISYRVLLTFRL